MFYMLICLLQTSVETKHNFAKVKGPLSLQMALRLVVVGSSHIVPGDRDKVNTLRSSDSARKQGLLHVSWKAESKFEGELLHVDTKIIWVLAPLGSAEPHWRGSRREAVGTWRQTGTSGERGVLRHFVSSFCSGYPVLGRFPGKA